MRMDEQRESDNLEDRRGSGGGGLRLGGGRMGLGTDRDRDIAQAIDLVDAILPFGDEPVLRHHGPDVVTDLPNPERVGIAQVSELGRLDERVDLARDEEYTQRFGHTIVRGEVSRESVRLQK